MTAPVYMWPAEGKINHLRLMGVSEKEEETDLDLTVAKRAHEDRGRKEISQVGKE